MKLATTTDDFCGYPGITQEESMVLCREAGFHFIDYDFHFDYKARIGTYGDNWREYAEHLKEHAKTLNQQFVQAHAPMGNMIPFGEGEAYTAFIEATQRSIECCHILGIDNLVVHAGYAPDLSKDDAMEKNRSFYCDLLPFAEKFGVNILVENFPVRSSKKDMFRLISPYDLVELIALVDHPLFHACWDTGHGNTSTIAPDECVQVLGDHLYGLHVQDNICNLDLHVPPFCGSLNIDSLMHGLLEMQYKGYFTFESCYTFLPASRRNKYEQDNRLLTAPLSLKIKAESLLYEIGKTILSAYDCYEE